MTSIAESLRKAETVLAASGVVEPRREAMSLLILAINKDKTFLYARPEHVLTEPELTVFDGFVRRRAGREPLQHISGLQEFYGLEFEVTPDVLIPRPETEMIVERAINLLSTSGGNICDVGIGSGCIAISILHELMNVHAIGLDASARALLVAGRNASKHGVAERLELLESDLFNALTNERFDVIVANPPYIPEHDMDHLQPEVFEFEPHQALTDGSDGLTIIRQIVRESPPFLLPGGYLLLEIGIDQAQEVGAMFDKTVWFPPEIDPDLQGIPRLVSCRLI